MNQQGILKNLSCTPLLFFTISFLFFAPQTGWAMEDVSFVQEIKMNLREPTDVVISATKDIYVLDKKSGFIVIYDALGQMKSTLGEPGSTSNYLSRPSAMTLTLEGDVIVADTGNNRIAVYSPEGDFLYELGNYGKDRGQFIMPTSVAVDPLGYIYVADSNNKTLSKYSPRGVFLGVKNTDFSPMDLVFDVQMNMYVLFTEIGQIVKYAPEGEVLKEIPCEFNKVNYLNHTVSIEVDQRGDLYIIETKDHTIKKIDQEGNILFSFGSQGTGRGQFDHPLNIISDGEDRVYVADSKNGRVQVLEISGSLKAELIPSSFKPPIIDFERSLLAEEKISDLFINQDEEILAVSDYFDHIVWMKQDQKIIGETGKEEGQFKAPQSIFVNYDGQMIIADSGNHRLQFLTKEGFHSYHFGVKGDSSSKFQFPSGVTVNHKGEIYVSDTLNNRIQIFNPDGIYLRNFGEKGIKSQEDAAIGKFNRPTALVFDSKQQLFVLDSQNKRIQVFTKDGEFIKEIPSSDNLPYAFSEPIDITLDEHDYLYVVDRGDHTVKIFEPDGKYFMKFGSPGKGPSYFPKVSSVAAYRGRIYVADYTVNKIKVFRFNPNAEWDYITRQEDLYSNDTEALLDTSDDVAEDYDYTSYLDEQPEEAVIEEEYVAEAPEPIYDSEEIEQAYIKPEPVPVKQQKEERIFLTVKSQPLTLEQSLDPVLYSNVRHQALQKVENELIKKLGISKDQASQFMMVEAEEILPSGQLMLTVSVSKKVN